jgi:thimet oligopeptidase
MKATIVLCLILAGLTVSLGFCAYSTEKKMLSEQIKSIEDVKNLFPISPEQIAKETVHYIAETQKAIDTIIAIPDNKRTFYNTAKALDDIAARANLEVKSNVFAMTEYLHPDKAMRDAAHDAIKKISDFFVDALSTNKLLYQSFKAYVLGNARKEQLNDEQRYFIEKTLKDYKNAGLDLPDDQLAKVKELKKKLSELTLAFDRNIADDNRTITVSDQELAGLSNDFIQSLKKDNDKYVLGVDYPTYFQVMEHCDVENTRKRLYEQFSNRGYPANAYLLKEIVAVRDELAKTIGFANYAALNIDNQMAQTPERVDAFLKELRNSAQKKAEQEVTSFTQSLPSSVTLMQDGKIKMWDYGRIKTHFKEQNFCIDERAIAEYFPMQKTIDALLDIYQQFMGVHFKEVSVSGLWHEDVRMIEVSDNKSQILGYLLLDLHPRPNKYTHAAHAALIPAIKLPDGSRLPAVSVLMANFPKAMQDKPALLMRSDVNTFFHEFGHAVHALLGATQLGSFAGTHVKTDFVEMPSQMLEEWLWDKDILKKVSSHYKTGEPLSDEMIDSILALKRYDSGNFIVRQAMLAQYSLDIYKEGAQKDPETLWFALTEQFLPHLYAGPEYRHYASFGHLTGYGAKYYGYLWSKVFALDLFDTIKQHGLLNSEIGAKYVQEVIGKGGSCDPNTLLANFLGRAPSQEAFLRDMGL